MDETESLGLPYAKIKPHYQCNKCFAFYILDDEWWTLPKITEFLQSALDQRNPKVDSIMERK